MLPNHHSSTEIPVSLASNDTCKSRSASLSTAAYVMAYFYLTFNTIRSIHLAYINKDIPMVVFVIFVYFGYFPLCYCYSEYSRLPSNDKSPKKKLLEVTIWGLTSAIIFGFVYQFSTFMTLAEVVPLYGIAILGSAFLFYVYFIYDHHRASSSSSFKNAKIDQFPLSNEKSSDKDIDHAISIVEKV